MSAPWIEAWKAWLARGAELFSRPGPPAPGKPQRAAPEPRSPAPREHVGQKPSTHRSGQRHG